jgi:hypothetical protein
VQRPSETILSVMVVSMSRLLELLTDVIDDVWFRYRALTRTYVSVAILLKREIADRDADRSASLDDQPENAAVRIRISSSTVRVRLAALNATRTTDCEQLLMESNCGAVDPAFTHRGWRTNAIGSTVSSQYAENVRPAHALTSLVRSSMPAKDCPVRAERNPGTQSPVFSHKYTLKASWSESMHFNAHIVPNATGPGTALQPHFAIPSVCARNSPNDMHELKLAGVARPQASLTKAS